jgi:hypothetical protein
MGIESTIVASTGFQRNVYPNRDEMLNVFLDTISSDNKTIEYVQTRLRSAIDIYKKGGHVTSTFRDQQFRMHFDNRRLIVEPVKTLNVTFLDSKPLIDVDHAENLRAISKMSKTGLYSRQTSGGGKDNSYKTYEDLAIRNFVKGVLSNPPLFNLEGSDFKSYKAINEFLKGYKSSINYTPQIISNLKNRSIKWKSTPRTPQSEDFIKYVKSKIVNFDVDSFFRTR